MKMFYQQFLAFFLMITITLLTLGMTFLGLSRSMFYQNTWDRLQDYAYMRSRLRQWTSDREKIRKSLSTRRNL